MRPKARLSPQTFSACAALALVLTVHAPSDGKGLDLLLFAARWTGNTLLIGCIAAPFLYGRTSGQTQRPIPRRVRAGAVPRRHL
ncbi:MAG: hypothetical protein JST30_02690 [Armatimonadetes bacterium]|nr:hypothetical protein [Armatimonadota bacterium]